MNLKLDPIKTGLGVGSLMIVMHVIWSLFVVAGLAQAYLDWILSVHFLNNPYKVGSFDFVTAFTLWIVAGLVGFAVGWVFANIWNYWQKK